jgi:antitoxin VapB
MTRAKLFTIGGSQAVCLPAEFRFEGDEVEIRWDSVAGDVVLSKPIVSWDDYLDWVRTLNLPSDLVREREQSEDDMRDPLPSRRRGLLNFCSIPDSADCGPARQLRVQLPVHGGHRELGTKLAQ